MGERKDVYRVLVGKPEGKRQLGRPKHRLENNIKMNFQEVGGGGVTWVTLAQNRECGCECGNHSGSVKCGEFLDWLRTCWLLKKDSAAWSKLVNQFA
jgi:hypothetical protein